MVPQGQTPGRPVDPDPTGGYYQPVRLIAPKEGGDLVGVGETRLACGLAGATPDVLEAFQGRYHANINPAVASLGVVGGATFQTDDNGVANAVALGAHLTLRATWAACPSHDVCNDGVCGPDETATSCPADCTETKTKAVGCTGAERYAALQLATQVLVDQRESIGVAWFATAGSFDADRPVVALPISTAIERQRLAGTGGAGSSRISGSFCATIAAASAGPNTRSTSNSRTTRT